MVVVTGVVMRNRIPKEGLRKPFCEEGLGLLFGDAPTLVFLAVGREPHEGGD